MLRKYSILFILFPFIIAACSQDVVIEQNMSNNDLVQISATIENINSNSRATVGVDGRGQFEEKDVITLLYGSNQQNLTLSSNSWTPSVHWGDLDQMAFSGFYPALTNSVNNSFKHSVAINQKTAEAFENSDLLYAPVVTANRGEIVNLEFQHLMSCLTVVLNGLTEEELAQAELTIKAYSAIDVLLNGNLGKLYDFRHGVSMVSEIQMRYQGDNTFQAILCPQSVADLSYGEFWLKIRVSGKDYNITDPKFERYLSGKNYTLTYQMRKPEVKPEVDPNLEADKVAVTDWVYGLSSMPPSDNPAWVYFTNELGPKKLPWGNGSGWYDCDKRYTNDTKLCWAAASSNVIHWWLDRNSSIIGDYCITNNVPYQYGDHLSSEVFQAFKDSFFDEGSFETKGLDWFFLGRYTKEPGTAGMKAGSEKRGGYFKDALSSVPHMVDKTNIVNIDQFSEVLKDAFYKRQGITFSVDLPGFGGAHAMTIWGAGFNKDGKVLEIYYCDNNDGTDNYMIGAKVKMQGSDVVLMGSTGDYGMVIKTVSLLNLYQGELKKYFQNK